MSSPSHPRVLFVTPVGFNPYSGGGATFASLFQGWPKDSLATVHNDGNAMSHDVCNRYFRLGPAELDLVPPFNYLRHYAGHEQVSAATAPLIAAPQRSAWKDRTRAFLFGDSLPERGNLTPALERWIAEYQPDLLYTILGGNGLMELIEKIRDRFRLPLVLHIMDDWATSAHRTGLLAAIERGRMERWLEHFMQIATSCLAICPAMSEAYAKRYGRPFTDFQYAIDTERWRPFAKRDLTPKTPARFLYVGSIFRDAQLQSLIDCAQAISEMNIDGHAAELRIVSSVENCTRYRSVLELSSNIQMLPPIADDNDFFKALGEADTLLLPVNFDTASIDFIRYSMPTKLPSYLLSGTPTLGYGPLDVAQVRYAHDAGWGHVVAQRSIPGLKEGLRRIIEDMPLRRRLVDAAQIAVNNHDANVVRRKFQDLLNSADTTAIRVLHG